MEIDYELLKNIAVKFILDEDLHINDAISIELNAPLIVTTHHIKTLTEQKLKCFFEFISISNFDVDRYSIPDPYEYLKNTKLSKTSEGQAYDTYLGEIYNNLFYTIMYVYVVDFNKHEKENNHE